MLLGEQCHSNFSFGELYLSCPLQVRAKHGSQMYFFILYYQFLVFAMALIAGLARNLWLFSIYIMFDKNQ